MIEKPRICFITAVPMTVTAFLNVHIERLAADFEVFVISDFSSGGAGISSQATLIDVPIPRKIDPLRDLAALARLWRIFRQYRFDIIHSVTPKAGLLSMMAGTMAGIPRRIHWFTGQVWVTREGVERQILRQADRLLAALATDLLADSPSQRDFLVSEGICAPGRIGVIGCGSICGVDSARFRPQEGARGVVCEANGIPPTAKIILFLGRLNVDKGLRELAVAVNRICPEDPNAHFLIVGPDEENMMPCLQQTCRSWLDRLHFKDFTAEPELYMGAADIFCLPSYREGFGSSVLEAAAAGIPAVATRIYGLTDAVEDTVTGFLVPPRDSEALSEALRRLLVDGELRHGMGSAARERALNLFSRQRIADGLYDYYRHGGGRI